MVRYEDGAGKNLLSDGTCSMPWIKPFLYASSFICLQKGWRLQSF